MTQNFFSKWGIHHRKSAAYHPQSNGRAEVAVKSAKRLLRSNISPAGSLDSDKFLRALLQLRNTPDPDCSLSPAQIVFGKPLRDAFSFVNRLEKFKNDAISPIWRDAWELKEKALRSRFVKTSEILNRHSRNLTELSVGDRCFVQNQTGNNPNKWDRTGTVMEVNPHDQYTVRIDGSGRLTTRNRRFLRQFQPATTEIQPAPPVLNPAPFKVGPAPPGIDPVSISHVPNVQVPLDNRSVQIEEPSTEASSPPQPCETSKVSKPIPLMLRRLLSHNDEGLQEQVKPQEDGGRKLRSKD